MRHPSSDGPSGKADALKKLVYYFRVFNQNRFFRFFVVKKGRGDITCTCNFRIFRVNLPDSENSRYFVKQYQIIMNDPRVYTIHIS